MLPCVSLAYDFNTVGYTQIKELKSWDGHIDVYLADGQGHKCSETQVTRFTSDPAQQNHYSLLMAAFLASKEVSLAYDCVAGIPIIVGVRVR
jgi:hypothetical protein